MKNTSEQDFSRNIHVTWK